MKCCSPARARAKAKATSKANKQVKLHKGIQPKRSPAKKAPAKKAPPCKKCQK
jgi:hypothetical protein